MQRLTISVDDELAEAFEVVIRERGYANRSEAFRDLLRTELGRTHQAAHPDGPCIATLSYVYNHHQRQLAARLTDLQHDHHQLTVSTTHAHLDHEHCVEVVILRGPVRAVQAFADSVIAQPGVSHGQLHLVPMVEQRGHGHAHLVPASVHRHG